MATTSALLDRLAAARAAIASLRSATEAGAPWPLSASFGVEPEATWGPPETLAHVAEMLPFWLGEIERVLAVPGDASEPARFGRVASNELRIGIIERDRSLPLRELFSRIDAGCERVIRRLGELRDDEWARRGRHQALGEFTVAEIVERFLVGHLDEHVRQLEEILGPTAPEASR